VYLLLVGEAVMLHKQLEIGTSFSIDEPDNWDDRNGEWFIGGYIYYNDDLFYVCFNEDGEQKDFDDETVYDAMELAYED